MSNGGRGTIDGLFIRGEGPEDELEAFEGTDLGEIVAFCECGACLCPTQI
jgi:hypothetical protein